MIKFTGAGETEMKDGERRALETRITFDPVGESIWIPGYEAYVPDSKLASRWSHRALRRDARHIRKEFNGRTLIPGSFP